MTRPTRLAPKLARDDAVAFLSAMTVAWDLVNPKDFHPEYWVMQARSLLKTGKLAPKKLRLRRVRGMP